MHPAGARTALEAPNTPAAPDLDGVARTNPDCRPEHPYDTVRLDDAATWRITAETYRRLGRLTPGEIRRERERLGLTRQELQEPLGLGGNSLSRWENGHICQARSLNTLLRVVFGVPDSLDTLSASAWKEASGRPPVIPAAGPREFRFPGDQVRSP